MAKPTIIVYAPNARQKMGFFQVWVLMFRNILDSRNLIVQLFKRDFLAAYKKSFFGITWVLIGPILGVLSWIFMNMTGILHPGDVGIPYPAYVMLSTSIWGIFYGFYTSATATLTAGAGFILQVKYPHEALLLKQTAQHVANSLIALFVNLVVLIALGVYPSWKIIFLPLVMLPLFFLASGIGLVMSVISIVSVEAQKFFDFLLGMAIWITPVVYSSRLANPKVQEIIQWNPLTYLIGGARDLIIYGHIDFMKRYILVSFLSFGIFLISWRLFFISEEKVIEKIL